MYEGIKYLVSYTDFALMKAIAESRGWSGELSDDDPILSYCDEVLDGCMVSIPFASLTDARKKAKEILSTADLFYGEVWIYKFQESVTESLTD